MGHDLVAISAGTFVLKVVAQRVYRSTAQHSRAKKLSKLLTRLGSLGFPEFQHGRTAKKNFVAVKEFNQFFDILLIRVKSEFNFTAIHLEN